MPWPPDLIPRQPSWSERLSGHKNTLAPFVSRTLRPLERPSTRAWQTELVDPVAGRVTLSGQLLDLPSSDLLVVVHGLGGSTASGYMALALRAAAQAGRKCLLLNTRGADRRGFDFNHAGLVEDLQAALSAPEFAAARKIDIFGYSLGGHTTLRYASGAVDPRVRAVAAIGSPLDLSISADAFDRPRASVYRGHVMRSLHEIYTASYQRRATALTPEQARKIQRIRTWDDQVVAPRFGFASAEAYYKAESAGPRLSDLSVPALYVGAPADPMIPLRAVLSAAASPRLRVAWSRTAGHLGFPDDFDLGEPVPLGLESQVLGWLRAQ